MSLVPALCWCYFFCWDMVVVTRFIQGHQSLCSSLCSRGEGLSCRSKTDLGFLPPSENLWRLGSVRVQTYHNHIKSREMHWGNLCGERVSYNLSASLCMSAGYLMAHIWCMYRVWFFTSAGNYEFTSFYPHVLTFYERFKWSGQHILSMHLT